MLKFIEENGIKKEIFIKTYRSDEVSQKVKLANELQEEYRVNNTPSLLIKNKYVTSPNLQLNSRNAQDYVLSLFNFSNNSVEKEMSSIQDTFLVADYLLQTK